MWRRWLLKAAWLARQGRNEEIATTSTSATATEMLRIAETQFDRLSGWRPQVMDMPLERVKVCPCCLGAIEDVAGIYCGQIVVLSECRSCGWLGYGIRPRQEWFDSFYASDWDEAGQGATDVDLSKCGRHPIAEFIPQIVKAPATVCDVGCGFGIAAWQLKQMGYDVVGIEKCDHRRNVAARNSIATYSSLGSVWMQLNGDRKFDVITAHHVLEHCVDPDAFVKEIAEHQDEGGIMYLSVPNQIGEPAMGCLLFLPHLHSFTVDSLCRLAERHGYSLMAYEVCGFNIQLAFVKRIAGTVRAEAVSSVNKLSRAIHANGQGPLLSWCGNYSDAWFTSEDRFSEWAKEKWKPRALRAQRVAGSGRFPVEVEVPCLFVK
jgi:SAM-dependent methyltransferase